MGRAGVRLDHPEDRVQRTVKSTFPALLSSFHSLTPAWTAGGARGPGAPAGDRGAQLRVCCAPAGRRVLLRRDGRPETRALLFAHIRAQGCAGSVDAKETAS